MKKEKLVSSNTKEIKHSKKVDKTVKTKNETRKYNLTIIIVLVALAIVVIGVCYFFFSNNNKPNNNEDIVIPPPSSSAGTSAESNTKLSNVKIVTVKGDANVAIYDRSQNLINNINLDAGNIIKEYATIYTDKKSKNIEVNASDSIASVSVKGTGTISIWVYIVKGENETTKGYELNDINIDNKEIIIDIKTEDITFKTNDNQELKPVII